MKNDLKNAINKIINKSNNHSEPSHKAVESIPSTSEAGIERWSNTPPEDNTMYHAIEQILEKYGVKKVNKP